MFRLLGFDESMQLYTGAVQPGAGHEFRSSTGLLVAYQPCVHWAVGFEPAKFLSPRSGRVRATNECPYEASMDRVQSGR